MDDIIKMLDENLCYISHAVEGDRVFIKVKSILKEPICPRCKASSSKVHSRYVRKFQDLPIDDKKVIIVIENRKMFCQNLECSYKKFVENFSFLPRGSKRTTRLEQEILRISINCSSIASSKILSKGFVDIGKSAICRLIKKHKT